MASFPSPTSEDPLVYKVQLIEEILASPDLYAVLGASPNCAPTELRHHYLDRCRIVHPDKLPTHALATPAFQRLSHAYEILRKPSMRAHYDRESRYPAESKGTIGVETTFRGAVLSILREFLHGDFQLVRRLLTALSRQYPNLINDDVVNSLERSFARMRELVLTTQTYALLLSIELGRLHRVQRKLFGLGYFDVVGRMRVGMQLIRVTLAIPLRVDRALRRKEEREWRARQAGRESRGEREMGTRLLNERVAKVLKFIAGDEIEDMPEDFVDGGFRSEAWEPREGTKAA